MLKALLLAGVLTGLCLPAHANTTAPGTAGHTVPDRPLQLAQTDLAIPPPGTYAEPSAVRVTVLLPLRSDTLRVAAEAVRAGFEAAYDRDPVGVDVQIIETGDASDDALSAYADAGRQSDIVVGPMTRSGVTAVAVRSAVTQPTIALAQPDNPEDGELVLPPNMVSVGLSVEEEARQVANWAHQEHAGARAVVLLTRAAWQRRAAKAFESEWQRQGGEIELFELPSNDGFIGGREVLDLKKQMESARPVVLFAALDARQARQVRALMGTGIPLYGTSQINPFTLADQAVTQPVIDMDGTRLVDIPWQLSPDDPAVMAYPRMETEGERRPGPDRERLYALGIDAYRVAHEIAMQRREFELDGVTGKLIVRMDPSGSRFERIETRAVYRGGSVVPAGTVR